MKKKFSTSWKSSTQPRKQRKYLKNAPLHLRRKLFSSTLSKDLRKKYKRRSIPLKVNDKVKILRGQFKKKEGKVTEINTKKMYLYIDTIQVQKKNGSKVFFPVHPSNVMITELDLEDKERRKIMERSHGTPQKN